jgi:amidophosphoribosyltransferase
MFRGSTITSCIVSEGTENIDAFELIYLARPDSRIAGRSVYSARYNAGKILAKKTQATADIVVGVPDSGLSAAAGFAYEAGLPYIHGLLKNRYIGRTFIEPEKIRRKSVELKFNVIVEAIAGKNIFLVDDSLVRGNTMNYVITLLRNYGAKSVHVQIASPPVMYPDYYGIDTPKDNDLLASTHSVEEMASIIGADSLNFLTLDELVDSIGLPKTRINTSSFDGIYPIPVPYSPK